MQQDLIGYICLRATKSFGGNDGMFNAAGFSNQLEKITGVKRTMDGETVRAILWGREDIEALPDGAHYKLRH